MLEPDEGLSGRNVRPKTSINSNKLYKNAKYILFTLVSLLLLVLELLLPEEDQAESQKSVAILAPV